MMYPPRPYDRERDDRPSSSTSAYPRSDHRSGRPDEWGSARVNQRERLTSPRPRAPGPSAYGPGSNQYQPADPLRRPSDAGYRQSPSVASRSRDNARPGASPTRYGPKTSEISDGPGSTRYERRSNSIDSPERSRDGPPRQPASDRAREDTRAAACKERSKEASRDGPRDEVVRDGGAREIRARDALLRDNSITPMTADGFPLGAGQADSTMNHVSCFGRMQRAMGKLSQTRESLKQFEDYKQQLPADHRQRADVDKKIQLKEEELEKMQRKVKKLADVTAAALSQCVQEILDEALERKGWKPSDRADTETSTPAGPSNGKRPAIQAPVPDNIPPLAAPANGVPPMPNNSAAAVSRQPTDGAEKTGRSEATVPAAPTVPSGLPTPTPAAPTPATTATPATVNAPSPATKKRKLKTDVAQDIQTLKTDVEDLTTQVFWVEDSGNDRTKSLQDEIKVIEARFTAEIADLRKTLALERKARQNDRTNSQERHNQVATRLETYEAEMVQMRQSNQETQHGNRLLRELAQTATRTSGLTASLGFGPVAGP